MLCTFSACSCGPSPCVTGGGVGPGGTGGFGGAGGAGGDDQVGYVGQQVSVALQTVETFSACDGQQVTVTGAEVEVLDPTNAKVAATGSTPVELAGDVTVNVSFTPATPGPYHITVRFEPNGATVQQDLLVAVDKSNELAQTETLSPDVMNGCNDVDVDLGPAHTVLCLANGGALYSMQNGQTIGSPWPADWFALSEGKVWTYATLDSNLHVLGLGSDGSLTDLASQWVEGVSRALVQGDDALVLSSSGFVEAHYSADGGLSLVNATAFESPEFAQWVPNVGVQIFDNFHADICSFSLAGGNVQALNFDPDGGTCTGSSNVNIIGFDDDGLWALDAPGNFPDLQTVEVTGWQAGAARSSAGSVSYSTQTPTGSPGSIDSPREVTPILYMHGPPGSPSDLYLPHFDGNVVTLTRYPFVADNDVHADSKRLWRVSNGTLTWWPR